MADFFENLGKTISKATNTAVDKTEDFFTVTKIKGKIAEEDRMINQICSNIGHIVYKEYLEGKELSDTVVTLCQEIERHEKTKKAQKRDLALFQNK